MYNNKKDEDSAKNVVLLEAHILAIKLDKMFTVSLTTQRANFSEENWGLSHGEFWLPEIK